MQTECESRQAFFEIAQETLRIAPVLEPDDLIIGVPHDVLFDRDNPSVL